MTYGLDQYILFPPFSLVFSIILIIGVYQFGSIINKNLKFDIIIKEFSHIPFVNLLVGLYFIGYLLFFLSLIGVAFKIVFQIIAFLLITLALYEIFRVKIFFNKLIHNLKLSIRNLYLLIIIIILFLYFIISSSPITNADALDYHIGVPIHILNTGSFPSDWSWFHAKQAGTGELLIALGLSIGAEQFGNLSQSSGLISLVSFFLFLGNRKNNKNKIVELIIIALLSSPILIFLSSTPKPQLLNIAGTTFSFCITFFCLNKINKQHYSKAIFLIFSVLFISITSKYYFAFSSFLITIFVFLFMYKKKYFLNTSIIFLSTAVLFLAPFFLWKYINFDQHLFHSIFSAVPRNLPGYESFNESLSSCGYRCFPTWIVYPPSINEFTQTFGLVSIFFILLLITKTEKKKVILFLLIIYFTIGLKLGQSNPRFFLEPVIWMLLWIVFYSKNENLYFIKFAKLLIVLQSVVIISILVVSAYFLFPGSINKDLRKNVMVNYANGYSLFQWSSSVLPPDAKIISSHRSIGLSTSQIFPLDFLSYTSNKKDIEFYLEDLKSKKPKYLITYGNEDNYFGFEKCVIRKLKEKVNVGKLSTRNFYLNKNREFYNGYIYLFDYNKLPHCYKK